MGSNSKEYMKANYKKYWGNPKAIADRSKRNTARRKVWLKKWDPREVQHKDHNPQNNSISNLSKVTRTYNRVDWAKKANRRRVQRRTIKIW